MKEFDCPGCPNRTIWHIVTLHEDYVILQCPDCHSEIAVVAGQDLD